MIDLIIIGCGKTKLDRPAPARDLYIGSLFQAKRRYAEASGVPWVIASALYGLVFPGEEIEPYDCTLQQLDSSQLVTWRRRVRYFIACNMAIQLSQSVCIELHAGERYREEIKIALWHCYDGIEFIEPTAGMGIGKQLGWYRKQRERNKAT